MTEQVDRNTRKDGQRERVPYKAIDRVGDAMNPSSPDGLVASRYESEWHDGGSNGCSVTFAIKISLIVHLLQ